LPSYHLTTTILVTPDKTNLLNKGYGSVVLKPLEQVTYARASRHAEHHVVTLSIDQATFRKPILAGEPLIQEARYVNSYFLTMAAMDENCKLGHTPTFIPVNPDDVRCHKAAELRRYMRSQFEEKFNQIHAESILGLEVLLSRAIACR
jgi:acyl-CoA hydrolase